jgi:hypothetical protein
MQMRIIVCYDLDHTVTWSSLHHWFPWFLAVVFPFILMACLANAGVWHGLEVSTLAFVTVGWY